MAILKTTTGWQVNVQPGGRMGRRIRKTFRLKDHAEAFQRNLLDQAERAAAGMGADLTISELVEKFDREYAAITFRGYGFEKYRLRRFRDYFTTHNRKLSLFSAADALGFISQERGRGQAQGSIARDITMLKRIASWAVENDLLPYDPLQKIKRLKGGKRTRWLNENEIDQVLASCKSQLPEIWEPVFVALMTGFRLGNILALRGEDFDTDRQIVWARKTKSGKPYAVPIDPKLSPLVPMFKARQGLLFPVANLDKKFKGVMTTIGFYKGKGHQDSVVFHTLRHSFGAYWLNRGVPIYTVSQWLGHSSVQMTESVYAHLSLQHHVEVMQKAGIGRHSVDTQIIPFPQNPSESIGSRESRTHNLVLKRDE